MTSFAPPDRPPGDGNNGNNGGSNGGGGGSGSPRRTPRCPICSAPTELEFRPFCSRRCAEVDLSRWLRGGYAIPGRVDVDEDGDDVAAAGGTPRSTLRDSDENDE